MKNRLILSFICFAIMAQAQSNREFDNVNVIDTGVIINLGHLNFEADSTHVTNPEISDHA